MVRVTPFTMSCSSKGRARTEACKMSSASVQRESRFCAEKVAKLTATCRQSSTVRWHQHSQSFSLDTSLNCQMITLCTRPNRALRFNRDAKPKFDSDIESIIGPRRGRVTGRCARVSSHFQTQAIDRTYKLLRALNPSLLYSIALTTQLWFGNLLYLWSTCRSCRERRRIAR